MANRSKPRSRMDRCSPGIGSSLRIETLTAISHRLATDTANISASSTAVRASAPSLWSPLSNHSNALVSTNRRTSDQPAASSKISQISASARS